MKRIARRKIRQQRADGERWLVRHPRVAQLLHVTGCLRVDERAIARGVAAGLFVALTPLFGVQTLLLLVVCVLLGANFVAGFVASWLCNPFTLAPIVLAANTLGRTVFEPAARRYGTGMGLDTEAFQQALWTLLGSPLIATPVALLGYAAALWVQRAVLHRRK